MKRIAFTFIVVLILICTSVVGVAAKTTDVKTPGWNGLEKAVFIHYAAPGKPPGTPGNGPKDKDPTTDNADAYKLFRGGIKWAEGTTVEYSINTYGSGVPNSTAIAAIVAAFDNWDSYIQPDLFEYDPSADQATDFSYADGNDIFWADLEPGVIAVTYFWWFSGTKELAAFDMAFNTDYPWGVNTIVGEPNDFSGNTSFMDITNIATHEAGHTLVLEDLYQSQYSEMTMYGYSDYGEVKAISLEPGDIAGAQRLYGAP